METLLHVGFSNAVAATVLALFALGITRVWRNPFAAHVLWLIVLLKLVTPPLIEVPMPFLGQVAWFDQHAGADAGSRVANQARHLRLDDDRDSNVATSVPDDVASRNEAHSPDFEIAAAGRRPTSHSAEPIASRRTSAPTAIWK